MGTDATGGLSPTEAACRLSPDVEVLAALEALALRDLRAQTERLARALEQAAGDRRRAAEEAGELGRARTAAADALLLYGEAQAAHAAAQQRARWHREEQQGDDG